ncbi:hypothetical protein PoB_006781100 [Plakobranchus ocellatus]|uniref:Uncharacterized protein n=1 Tax=Plakobranchus ocellatus TaxID=259542 RepID=A0AAV4DAY7_9GAST|nr:hypothetical protein PoB_006781100 [Plakobranchus ocellatus]
MRGSTCEHFEYGSCAGRIPGILYGTNSQNNRPELRYIDVYEMDRRAQNIDENIWERMAVEQSAWTQTLQKGPQVLNVALAHHQLEKRVRYKASARQTD